MVKFYNIAHGTRELENAGNFPWPYDIDICFDDIKHPIAFSEGVGHASAGCAVTAHEALEEKWREHFEITNSFWLLPYIERLVEGTPLPQEEIIAIHRELNGQDADTYESNYS